MFGGVRPSYVYIEEGTEWGTTRGLLIGFNAQGNASYKKTLTIDGIRTLKSPIFGTYDSSTNGTSYTGLYMDTIEIFNTVVFYSTNYNNNINWKHLKFISAKKAKRGFGLPFYKAKSPVLEDVIVGEFEDNLNLIGWTPTTVIATEGGATLLDDNIRNHIAANVKDVSQGEPLTITFSQELRNVLTQETEDLFASKGWNIAPTKSV